LISNHLCSITELSEALGENRKNIERYARCFREKGAEDFFSRKETRGQCYKVTGELLETIQQRLDEGWSIYRTAQSLGISESAISYHLKKGTLKKKAMS
jgi:biotin operon repressor